MRRRPGRLANRRMDRQRDRQEGRQTNKAAAHCTQGQCWHCLQTSGWTDRQGSMLLLTQDHISASIVHEEHGLVVGLLLPPLQHLVQVVNGPGPFHQLCPCLLKPTLYKFCSVRQNPDDSCLVQLNTAMLCIALKVQSFAIWLHCNSQAASATLCKARLSHGFSHQAHDCSWQTVWSVHT